MAEASLTRNVIVATVVAAIMAGFVLAYTYLTPVTGPPMAGSPEGPGPMPQGAGMLGGQPGQPMPPMLRTAEPPLQGVWTTPFYCPMLRAAVFIAHTERGILGALLRLHRFKDRLLAGLGLGTRREAVALQAARQLLESYVFSTGNPYLQVGALRDLGEEVEGEIVTHGQELVERLRVDTRTGALWAVR